MKYLTHFLLAAMLTCVSPAWSGELIPFTAELEAIRHGTINLSTRGSLTLRRVNDEQWNYRLETDSRTVSLLEDVWFTFENGEMKPQRYEYESRVIWAKNNKQLTFDHARNRVTGNVDKDKISMSFESPLYDPIGYQVVLQQRLQDGERDISFNVFRHKKPNRMAFRVIGEERLSLPTGDVYTWIVEQTAPIRSNERKLIWVAPNHNYIPLRFGRFEKGKLKEEIRTLSLKQNGQTITFDN